MQLDPGLEKRLEALARLTGRSKGDLLLELQERIEAGIEDLEDACVGAERVMAELGLAPPDA